MNFKRVSILAVLVALSATAAFAAPGLIIQTDFIIDPAAPFVELYNNSALLRGDTGDMVKFNKYYGYVATGFNGGAWDGIGGIGSSNAAADPTAFALGTIYNSLDGSQIYDTFEGTAVTGTDTLVKYTLMGDVTCDGVVDLTDYDLLYGNYNTTGQKWIGGDMTYDGTVDLTDFDLMYGNYGKTYSGPVSSGNLAAVPEPTTIVLLSICGLFVFLYKKFN